MEIEKNFMKYYWAIILPALILLGCDTKTADQKDITISKVHYKPNSKIIDTLWVSQNDTAVFIKKEIMTRNPERRPEPQTVYELKSPKDGIFYYIHDPKGLLVMAGRYDAQYIYDGIMTDNGNFYNVRYYSYRDDGRIKSIHYMEDGRNLKTETYNRKGQLDEVLYLDKKSGNTSKVEIYDNGEVKKTRVYTSFYNYYTVPGKTP